MQLATQSLEQTAEDTMTSTFPYFEKAVRRLNPEGAQRRERAEQQAHFDACMDRLSASLERSKAAWIIAAHEAGRADPDPFFQSKGN